MKDLGIDQLNAEQRVALALEIWESLGDARPAGRLTAEQRAELTRRNAELDAKPAIALTWEQIRASVEAKPQVCQNVIAVQGLAYGSASCYPSVMHVTR